jgi:spore coat protein U-like protein
MFRATLAKLSVSAVALLAASGVGAATGAATFPASASVISGCTVSATALVFGNYAPGSGVVDQTSSVTVFCSVGQAFTVGLNAGIAPGATVTVRRMRNGTNILRYRIFRNATRTQNWGNTVATSQSGTGAGFAPANARVFTAYGRILDNALNQAAPVGAYSDTVTATVTY